MEQVFNILQEFWYIIVIVLFLAQQIVKITPTEKDNDYLKKIIVWIAKINEVIPNKTKDGGKFIINGDSVEVNKKAK